MRALILNGSKKGNGVLDLGCHMLKEELTARAWSVTSFILRDMAIAPCMGCFDCWLKTPGVCIINDVSRDIVRHATHSDLWIFLTPVTFGGYSSELKKAIDRILPIFVPVFRKVNGEVHHKLRYDNRPVLIGIGSSESGSKEEEDIFKKLINRNAINFRSRRETAEILLVQQAAERTREQIMGALSRVGVLL